MTLRFPLGAVERDAFADGVGCRVLIENQIESPCGRAADRQRARCRDPDRRMRALRGGRLDDDILKLPIPAPMRKARARGPRAQDDLDRLLEAALRLLRWNAEALEFAVPVAFADTEIQP